MAKYVIDTCSLINAAKNYNSQKTVFKPLWDKFEEMISDGSLISTIEVRDELKDDDLVEWSKRNNKLFLPLTESLDFWLDNLFSVALKI